MSDLPPSSPPPQDPVPPPAPATTGASPVAGTPSPTAPSAGRATAKPGAAAAGRRPVRRIIPPPPAETKRDTIIAILCGAGVLAFVILGFFLLNGMKNEPSTNKLTGTIVEKYATGQVEKEISFGKKGVASEEVESGFYFKVQVPSENNRIFEMSVNEGLYNARKVGDQQSFIRPESEQK